MPQKTTLLALLTVAALSAPPAPAQDSTPDPAEDAPPVAQPQRSAGPSVTLRLDDRVQFQADLDNAPGNVSVNRAALVLSIADAINSELSYSLDFQAERHAYDFANATSIIAGTGDPLGDAYTLQFTPALRIAIDDEYAVRTGGSIIASGETDADIADALRAGLFVGVERRFNERLVLTLGVAAYTRLEDDAAIYPLIGLYWQINDLMRLQTRGLGAEFISDLGDGWTLGARAAWERREFRLSDDSSAPLPGGVLRDDSVIAAIELAWNPSKDVTLALELGGVFAQQLDVLNSSGSTLSETDVGSAFFIGARASIAF
ncbi:MAG: hypothetical protein H6814_05800 [Phycisphaeraceae bacterium]|nr:hypothetical protein [Phycisphaeraceae bacterium]